MSGIATMTIVVKGGLEPEGLAKFDGERWTIIEKGDALYRPHLRKKGA